MHAKLASLLRFYEARRDGVRLPARRAFLPEEMREWMGHLGIAVVERDPVRFKVLLSGTRLVQYEGSDFTGRYLDEAVPPHARDAILAPFFEALQTRQPVYDTFTPPDQPSRTMHRLVLPCADDGRTVDRFIVGMYWENPPDPFGPKKTVFDDVPTN